MTVHSCKSSIPTCARAVENRVQDKLVDEKTLIAKGFNKQARQYDLHSQVQQDIARTALAKLQNSPAKVQDILDLGCGTGAYLPSLQQHANRVIGIDISRDMLKQAQINANSLLQTPTQSQSVFINADAECLPLKNESVDMVFSSMALQWCFNPAQLLAEVHRVLKPQGRATLAILIDGSFNTLHQAYQTLGIPSRVNHFSASGIWLQAANQLAWQVEHNITNFNTQHTSLLAMLRSIKNVGANTKRHNSEGVDNAPEIHANSFISKAEVTQLTAILNLNKNVKTGFINKHENNMQLDYKVLFLELFK